MIFPKKDVVTSLHETSKTTTGTFLLEKRYSQEVYNFDIIKDMICAYYRDSNDKLKSCDAYYEDGQNYLAIEFKNTPHLHMKKYFEEISTKAFDTHMLLNETFWKNRKKLSKKVQFLVVYNDLLYDDKELHALNFALNTVTPFKGSKERNSKPPEYFSSEEEYHSYRETLVSKFKPDFYTDIQFLDKKDFIEDYINTSYFSELAVSDIIS